MIPASVPERWRAPLEQACGLYEIDNKERLSMFLAQLAHESGGFFLTQEDLRYSAGGLARVFKHRFTPEETVDFAHQPERIAERVYGGRLGNGPEGSGDGFKYRGRGLIQLTGRANYRKAGRALGLPLEDDPDMALDEHVAALVAAWYWAENGCNELADNGQFDLITRRINGGMNGYADRCRWLAKFEGTVLA
jgi:putative chitinase